MKYKEEFETVCSIIATHRKRVIRVVNNESMSMVWEVGGYVSHKLKTSVWGDGVVRQLSIIYGQNIRQQEAGVIVHYIK